jgi:hypothetical protein
MSYFLCCTFLLFLGLARAGFAAYIVDLVGYGAAWEVFRIRTIFCPYQIIRILPFINVVPTFSKEKFLATAQKKDSARGIQLINVQRF